MNQMFNFTMDNYAFAGDISVIALCLVMTILLLTSFVSRNRTYRIFIAIIITLMTAALVNILYHYLLFKNDPLYYNQILILGVAYRSLLLYIFFLFSLYTAVVSGLEHQKARFVAILSSSLLIFLVLIDIVTTMNANELGIREGAWTINRNTVFTIGYFTYVILIAVLMRSVGKLLFKRVMLGFYGTMIIAVSVRLIQQYFQRTSLTAMSFVFPAIAMMYIIHSHPYNPTMGTVDVRAMEGMVRDLYGRKIPFAYLSLLLLEFDNKGLEIPLVMRSEIRRISSQYFKGAVVFQIGNGHLIMVVPKRRNPDIEKKIELILTDFRKQYERFQQPYKIIIGNSADELSRTNAYIGLIRSIHPRMRDNAIHFVGEKDNERFNQTYYVLEQLTDIFNRHDLDDPRILTYCQPVFNLKTGRYDTAEALMRLKLDNTGIVYPDLFIPLAEQNGLIHVLTEIILNKTCQEIRRLCDEGYDITRISVNVSVQELKDDNFCSDITRIIDDNNISGSQIAIEITESRNELDFMIMKEKIDELHKKGIRFYLDDFGTGYSNMQRIMELPFDIIKFDRSLVMASGVDARSEKIVERLAHLFRDMNYSVLYEGIENDADEKRCEGMSASYLQGFKYSRPVPIEQLREFLK